MAKPIELKKLRRIRNVLLKALDKRGWTWDKNLSDLLCQVDAQLFGFGVSHDD